MRKKLIELIRKADKEDYTSATQDQHYEFMADSLIANGVTIQRWIPVSELPKEDGKYLVHKDLWGTHCISTIRFAKVGEKVCAYDLKGCKNVWYDYDSETGYFPVNTVTHWMPLPQPPKEEV